MAEIARFFPNEPVKRKYITETQGIPDSYLENILVSLKEGGLVVTVRGARGGYQLSKPPEEITVLQIVEALEGPINLVPCVNSSFDCTLKAGCTTTQVWKNMYESMKEVLESYTLKDLVCEKAESANHDFMI